VTAEELRELSPTELHEALAEAKAEAFNLRFQLATNQLDNTARLGDLRRQVARIMTVLREQELEAWQALMATADKEGA
jgi:large subunit ribosomal protein L29